MTPAYASAEFQLADFEICHRHCRFVSYPTGVKDVDISITTSRTTGRGLLPTSLFVPLDHPEPLFIHEYSVLGVNLENLCELRT